MSKNIKKVMLVKLNKCTDKQIKFFCRIYSDRINDSIEEVIEKMDDCKLDTALRQIENTIIINSKRLDLKLKKIKKRINEN